MPTNSRLRPRWRPLLKKLASDTEAPAASKSDSGVIQRSLRGISEALPRRLTLLVLTAKELEAEVLERPVHQDIKKRHRAGSGRDTCAFRQATLAGKHSCHRRELTQDTPGGRKP